MGRSHSYSKEQVVERLKLASEHYGRPFSMLEFEAVAHMCVETVIRIFGDWPAALSELGLVAMGSTGHSERLRVERSAAYIDKLQKIVERDQGVPSFSFFKKKKRKTKPAIKKCF